MNITELEQKAKWVRQQVLEMIASAGKGHIGGSYSCVEILVALYFGGILRYDPKNPDWPDRDRFILSKGHAAPALYPILADVGYFDISLLNTYCQEGSIFESHANGAVPGIEITTGSLGQGLGIGAGLALAAKMDGKDYLTFVLLGDGECYEGSVWEAANFASHHNLNNLIAIVDRNRQCVLDFTEDCNRLEPFSTKWLAFGWGCYKVNGHSFEDLLGIFSQLREKTRKCPLVIIAHTIKGRGVSFMEKNLVWHHKVPNQEELKRAREELR